MNRSDSSDPHAIEINTENGDINPYAFEYRRP